LSTDASNDPVCPHDTGFGIDAEARAQISEPFYETKSDRRGRVGDPRKSFCFWKIKIESAIFHAWCWNSLGARFSMLRNWREGMDRSIHNGRLIDRLMSDVAMPELADANSSSARADAGPR
jgi:hypothetical protein